VHKCLGDRRASALLPAGTHVVIPAEVEDRGRQPAAVAELRLCFGQLPLRGCGLVSRGDAYAAVALPPLGPGERVVIRRALALPGGDRELSGLAATADVDPDRILGERTVDDVAVSAPATTRLPVLQLLSVDLPSEPRAGSAFPVTLAVRNVSTVALSPATELLLRLDPDGRGAWGSEQERELRRPYSVQ
jgi:hypothetical protein